MPGTPRSRWLIEVFSPALLACLVVACGDSPTRPVAGSRTVVFWSDTGKSVPLPSADTRAPSTVVARTLDGKNLVTASFDANGSFQLQGAPVGPYILELNSGSGARHFFRTEAAVVDLGADLLGRSNVQTTTQPTQVTFELSGLAAADPQDLVEITCSNAAVWDRLAPQGTLAGGVTSASVPFAWAARPTPLVSGSSGDVLYVHQLSTRVDPGSGLAYQAAQTWAADPGLTVTAGLDQTTPVSLAPVSSSGRLTVSWRPSMFEAALTDWPAGTLIRQHSLFVEGIAWALDLGPAPRTGNPDLLMIQAGPGTPDATLDLPYGRFLPALWKERLQTYVTVRERFPYQGGTIFYSVRMAMQASMDALPAELAPTISPPRSLKVGGLDATQVRSGMGTGPVVSWTAPRNGTADYYAVDLEKLTISGTQVTFSSVATFHTTETSAQFPEGTLTSGTQVVAYVTAVREPTSHYATAPAPYRRHFPQDIAQAATAPFSP
ncbi:MAG TPA: hypothetical protein VMT11_02145 [Myxococcaceae bacterium]|nr:hypothetical protein [Myxococcaceae bacterium]